MFFIQILQRLAMAEVMLGNGKQKYHTNGKQKYNGNGKQKCNNGGKQKYHS